MHLNNFLFLLRILAILLLCRSDSHNVLGNNIQVLTVESCNGSSLAAGIVSMYKRSITAFNITFNCTQSPTVISITDQIWLYGSVDIDGGGMVTLDGSGFHRIFIIGRPVSHNKSVRPGDVRQPTVTLRNLVITNGGGQPGIVVSRGLSDSAFSSNETIVKRDGGCVYVVTGAIVYLYNVSFMNCKTEGSYVADTLKYDNDVTFNGGAIFLNDYVQLTAVNVSFFNNLAGQAGGAIYAKLGEGGAWPISVVLSGCVFDGNMALGSFNTTEADTDMQRGGGAICSMSSMYMSKTVFLNNTALYGGALRTMNADLFIDGCLFENNNAVNMTYEDHVYVGEGGAIYVKDSDTGCSGRQSIILTNSVFRQNQSPLTGAAVSMSFNTLGQTVSFNDIVLCDNVASSDEDLSITCGEDETSAVVSGGRGGVVTELGGVTLSGVSNGGDGGGVSRGGVTDGGGVTLSGGFIGGGGVSGGGVTDVGGVTSSDGSIGGGGGGGNSNGGGGGGGNGNDKSDDGNGSREEGTSDVIASISLGSVLGDTSAIRVSSRCNMTYNAISSAPADPVSCSTPSSDGNTVLNKASTVDSYSFPAILRNCSGSYDVVVTSDSAGLETTMSTTTTAMISLSTPLHHHHHSSSPSMADMNIISQFPGGTDAECKSFWDNHRPELAVDWDSGSCYESGFETDSWWMTRLYPGTRTVTQVTISGEIYGQTYIRIGSSYSAFDRPHYLTDTNPICANTPLGGPFKHLAIKCIDPLNGLYLSITVLGKDMNKTKICDVIVA